MPGVQFNQLVLCDSENERHKWVGMLQELLNLYNKTHGAERKVRFMFQSITQSHTLFWKFMELSQKY